MQKVRLIARVDLAFAAFAVVTWAIVGVDPATRWGAYAIIVALIGAVSFGAASLIGWIRLSETQRDKDRIAVFAGLISFTIGIVMAAFYAASLVYN